MPVRKKSAKVTSAVKSNGKKLAPPSKSPITQALRKSQIIALLSEQTGITKKQVVAIFESLALAMKRSLGKNAVGVFVLPNLAKFKVVRKPATKSREGINPFTGEPTTFKAKPARNVIKIRPLSALKEMVS